jgi:tetratricopeptide (TPR) repeat protein
MPPLFMKRHAVLAVALAVSVLAAVAAQARPPASTDAEYVNRLRMANRYIAQGVPDAAIKILEQLLAEYPGDVQVSTTYADALIGVDLLDEADAFLTKALDTVDEKTDLYRVRVKLRRAQNRPLDAFNDVLQVMNTKIDLASWAYRETNELLGSGLDVGKASDLVESLRKDHAATLEYTILAGVVAANRDGNRKALDLVTRFDKDNNRSGRALETFAGEMLSLGREDLGLLGLTAAAEYTPKPERRTPILFQIADIQERQEHYADALATLERIAQDREGASASANARLRMAQIRQEHLNDPQGALAVYETIQDDPVLGHFRPTMLVQMADCYVRLGQFEKASAKYTEAIPEAFDPEDAERSSLRLADIEFYRGNADSALVLYQNMAEANPRSLRADEAADRYILLNKYRSLGPQAMHDLGTLAWARDIQDSLKVEQAGEAVLASEPPSEIGALALLALSEAAERGGNYPRALQKLKDLVQRYPADRKAPEALMRQGRILDEKLDQPEEALTRYESVLTDYPASVQAGDARRLVETLRRALKS